MTSAEFKTKLDEAFKDHCLMRGRGEHTINELLHVLMFDERFKGSDFNLSIQKLDDSYMCIPCLDAFVDTKTRGIWFKDVDIEFEVEEFDDMKFNCITVPECERED